MSLLRWVMLYFVQYDWSECGDDHYGDLIIDIGRIRILCGKLRKFVSFLLFDISQMNYVEVVRYKTETLSSEFAGDIHIVEGPL